jgi:arylsulfatase A-like enzyme
MSMTEQRKKVHGLFLWLASAAAGAGLGAVLGMGTAFYAVSLNDYVSHELFLTKAALLYGVTKAGACLGTLAVLAGMSGGVLWLLSGKRRFARWLVLPLIGLAALRLVYLFPSLPVSHKFYFYSWLGDWRNMYWFWIVFGASVSGLCFWIWKKKPFQLYAASMLLCAAGAVCLIGFCHDEKTLRRAALAEKTRPNLIFLLVDALRPDHLGCYGYSKPTSPFMDALSRRGVLFERCYSQGNYTRMSVPSFFASIYPLSHGVRRREEACSEEFVMLAEVLKNHGYSTAAWMPNPSLQLVYNFFYGFDDYFDTNVLMPRPVIPRSRSRSEMYETASQINRMTLDWLKKNAGREEPFFVYLHYRDVHGPYVPPPPYNEMFYDSSQPVRPMPEGALKNFDYLKLENDRNDVNYYIAQYDGEIRYTDDQMKIFFEELEKGRFLENTLVVLSADHGESLGEHDIFNHGRALREEQVHVPLVLIFPDAAHVGKRVETMVELVDLLPTFLDYMDIPLFPQVQGRSMRPLLEGDAHEWGKQAVFLQGSDEIAVRRENWKLVVNLLDGKRTLYHLGLDPQEGANLLETPLPGLPEDPTQVAAQMDELLKVHIAKALKQSRKAHSLSINAELEKRLRSLGYLQ